MGSRTHTSSPGRRFLMCTTSVLFHSTFSNPRADAQMWMPMPMHSLQRQLGLPATNYKGRMLPAAPSELVVEEKQKVLEKEKTNDSLYDEFSTNLLSAGSYDDEDREADVIYRIIDRRQDSKRKRRREEREKAQWEPNVYENFSVSTRRALAWPRWRESLVLSRRNASFCNVRHVRARRDAHRRDAVRHRVRHLVQLDAEVPISGAFQLRQICRHDASRVMAVLVRGLIPLRHSDI